MCLNKCIYSRTRSSEQQKLLIESQCEGYQGMHTCNPRTRTRIRVERYRRASPAIRLAQAQARCSFTWVEPSDSGALLLALYAVAYMRNSLGWLRLGWLKIP